MNFTKGLLLGCALLAVVVALGLPLDGDWHVVGEGFEGVARLPGTLADAGFGTKQTYETWRALTERREKGALRLSHVYRGKATWSRTVDVPTAMDGKPLELYLERVLWVSTLKVDGRPCGSRDSLGTPHVYRFAPGELKPGPHEIEIEVDNSSHYGFTGKSHGWGWSTQTCWNGVIGRFELRVANPLESARVFAPYPTREVAVEFSGEGLRVAIDGTVLAGKRADGRYVFELPFQPKPWSESNPRLYELELSAGEHRKTVRIGFRTIERRGNRLFLNGVPLWIRGDVDNCQFPLTGYPAMTPAEWRRQIRIQRENGINAMRFHSWTPPEAAFEAADEMGFYLFPETGFWADATIPESNVGRGNTALDDFCRRELLAIADTYGNHACFLGQSLGNELGKCDFDLMNSWMEDVRKRDPRRLTMVSTARKVAASDDYMVTHLYPGVGPVRCRFREHTDWDYEDVYSKTAVPTIAHEIGQWPVYPLWTEIAKYDGLLRPFDWEAMRRQAETNGTLRFDRLYHRASLKANRFMYKDETEGYLRTPSCSGLQFLDVRDYTGQGEALVGWLDAFFDAKAGLSELPPFSTVLRPVAFLARVGKFVLTADESLVADLQVRNISESVIPAGTRYAYSFAGERGWVVLDRGVPPGSFSRPVRVSFPLDRSMAKRRQELRFGENRWSVFVMESAEQMPVPDGVTVTSHPDVAARTLAAGGRVVYTGRSRASVRGRFVPVYWSTVYFPIFNPCAMLGTWFDEDHPVFDRFPTEDWMDRQWRTLTDASVVHEVTGLPDDFAPLAMPVPDIHLSRLFATMFELRIGEGRLLVCGYPIESAETPEARQLRKSVLSYVASGSFRPRTAADAAWFAGFASGKRPEDLDADDWTQVRRPDGTLVLKVLHPPRRTGEYSILFGEDGVVAATCEGRPCGTFSAIPVAMVIARTTAEDASDGVIEFEIRAEGADVPPVASVTFRTPNEAPQL